MDSDVGSADHTLNDNDMDAMDHSVAAGIMDHIDKECQQSMTVQVSRINFTLISETKWMLKA